MGLTGRYDFPGIQKAMRLLINSLIASTSFGIWLVKSPFSPVITAFENLAINFLVNRGLIVLNVGANIVDGVFDQAGFDRAIDQALTKVLKGRDKITPQEGKAIDDSVKAAFDKDADLGSVDNSNGMSDVSSSSL